MWIVFFSIVSWIGYWLVCFWYRILVYWFVVNVIVLFVWCGCFWLVIWAWFDWLWWGVVVVLVVNLAGVLGVVWCVVVVGVLFCFWVIVGLLLVGFVWDWSGLVFLVCGWCVFVCWDNGRWCRFVVFVVSCWFFCNVGWAGIVGVYGGFLVRDCWSVLWGVCWVLLWFCYWFWSVVCRFVVVGKD